MTTRTKFEPHDVAFLIRDMVDGVTGISRMHPAPGGEFNEEATYERATATADGPLVRVFLSSGEAFLVTVTPV